MIEEFKDILLKYFESQGKVIDREKISLVFYEEIKPYIRGILATNLPDFEYYKIIYNGLKNEFSLDVYQKIKTCRITKNEE